jgi:hypothetical protein
VFGTSLKWGHDDTKSYVSLHLSHDCGSRWDSSDIENDADNLGNKKLCNLPEMQRQGSKLPLGTGGRSGKLSLSNLQWQHHSDEQLQGIKLVMVAPVLLNSAIQ